MREKRQKSHGTKLDEYGGCGKSVTCKFKSQVHSFTHIEYVILCRIVHDTQLVAAILKETFQIFEWHQFTFSREIRDQGS